MERMNKNQAITTPNEDDDAKVDQALAALLAEVEKTPVSQRLSNLVQELDAALRKASETRLRE